MHIHKINSTLKKHQNFLAQNRIDPITGDAILEGDEVIFCASCKSVFLKDSWEYLGKQHCQQSETLAKFPTQKVMLLKAEEEILFYTALPKVGQFQTSIPRQTKKEPWLKKSQYVSPFQNFLHNPFVKIGKNAALLLLYLAFIMQSKISVFPLIYIPLLLEGIIRIHDWYYGNKIKSIYKNFEDNTFYITKKKVGFASKYGIHEFVLPAEKIKEIVFHEKDNFLLKSYCQIYYERDGIIKVVKFKINNDILINSDRLILALDTLSMRYDVPIRIESTKQNTIYNFQKVIANGNPNFYIE